MKILYAIQATGNGHISRAKEIIPILEKKAQVDILLSGIQSDIELGHKVKYKLKGLSFIFGKKGGIDYYQTYTKNRVRKFLEEINSLNIKQYDVIINDFEPVSAWAAKKTNKPCIGLSNQSAVLSMHAPQPLIKDPIGLFILKRYAPVSKAYGFHFQKYNNDIYTPIIRQEVRNMETSDLGHYLVYLPSYDDEKIIRRLRVFSSIKWMVFSKHSKNSYQKDNIYVQPIEHDTFLKALASCTGILCGAGFATPSEALYLEKKLMIIPMKFQYEQQCNAEALKKMGVACISSLKKKNLPLIEKWLHSNFKVKVDYPDETETILDRILQEYNTKI
jgi:uncharacterized protein (TIGR00661 family)